jgi:hypothetical protein
MRDIRYALFLSVLACCTLPAHADTVLFGADINAPILSAQSVTGELTGGAEMAGMQVTANFVGGGTSTGTWATNVTGCTLAADCGKAAGAIGNGNWTLTESGNTGSVTDIDNPDRTAVNPWTLTNTSTDLAIASVVLNGIPAHKVFDRDLHSDGQFGTPGSVYGIDYTFHSESGANAPFTMTVTYAGLVTLDGPNQPGQGSVFSSRGTATGVGDLWSQLTFAFTGGGSFMATAASSAVWSFFQDTDTAAELGAGDYNGNGAVDAADYTIWRDTLGSTTDLRANGDNTGASAGKIDQADYLFWKANFGTHAGSGAATVIVAEPSTSLLLIFGCAVAFAARLRYFDRPALRLTSAGGSGRRIGPIWR